MWLPGRAGVRRCGLLDFQDAMRAPAVYDLVSLLEDARRDVPDALRDAMIERYLAAFPGAGSRMPSPPPPPRWRRSAMPA